MNEFRAIADPFSTAVEPSDIAAEARAMLEKLSPKQCDALRLVFVGKTSKEISRELGIVPRAVDQRLDAARKILGASERGEAARKFYELHCASEGLTSDPFLLGETGAGQGSRERDPSLYVFGDALTFTAPAAWEQRNFPSQRVERRFAPGLPSATSGPENRIMWIMIGALAILALVILGLGAVEGLTRLDAIV